MPLPVTPPSPAGNAFLYSGCLVAEGTALMFVTAVGTRSQWGIIKEHLSERDEENTPLQDKLEDVADLIGKVGLGVAIACFVVLSISWVAAGNYSYKEFVEESSWRALLDFLVPPPPVRVAVAPSMACDDEPHRKSICQSPETRP